MWDYSAFPDLYLNAYTNVSLSQNINFGQNRSAFPILFRHFSPKLFGWPTKQLVMPFGRNCWKWNFWFFSRAWGFLKTPKIYKFRGFQGIPGTEKKSKVSLPTVPAKWHYKLFGGSPKQFGWEMMEYNWKRWLILVKIDVFTSLQHWYGSIGC